MTLLSKIDPRKAVDLASPEFLEAVARQRRQADLQPAVALEIRRLIQRSAFLRRKAARQRIGSNARSKAIAEADESEALMIILQRAARDEQLPDGLYQAAATHAQRRAVDLVHRLKAA